MARIEIVVLGTASMVPTKDRNHTSIFLSYKDKGILLDCGEGTQRQLKIAGIKPSKIKKILITHWHGDHVLGLPGLLQTMGNSDYSGKLEIYGPKGSILYFENMKKSFAFDTSIEMEIKEISEGVFFEGKEFSLESVELDHGVPCLGYAFIEKDSRRMNKSKIEGLPGKLVGELQEGKTIMFNGRKISPDDVSSIQKGKKVSFVTDTEVCNAAADICKDSDLLLCEATYLSDLEEKGAKYKHMTAEQSALLASNNNVKKLVLCHFSGRYKTTKDLEDEARTIFPDTNCAYDLYKVKL